MAQQLEALTTILQRTQLQFLAPHDGSQPSLIPFKWYPTPS